VPQSHFCWKARQAGFRIFVDPQAVLGHITAATLTPVAGAVEIQIGEQMLRMPVAELERNPTATR
jgi:hypothetical protein